MGSDNRTLRELTKTENITDLLLERIVKGDLPAGSKISEPELAKQHEVSRGPLREALTRLEALGLIERIAHVGARVVSITSTKLVELYTIREALEGMAARLAARHITANEIQQIEALLVQHEQHIESEQAKFYFHQQGDFDFHYLIIKASRNERLIRLLCDELYQILRMIRFQSPRSHTNPDEALSEHRAILKAITDHDEEFAEMLMRRHIANSGRLIEAKMINKEKSDEK